MLPFPPYIELPPPNRFEQFCSFLMLYFVLLALTSLLLPETWRETLLKIAFPFLPETFQEGRDE